MMNRAMNIGGFVATGLGWFTIATFALLTFSFAYHWFRGIQNLHLQDAYFIVGWRFYLTTLVLPLISGIALLFAGHLLRGAASDLARFQ